MGQFLNLFSPDPVTSLAPCDTTCMIVLGICLGFALLVLAAGLLIWRTFKERKRKAQALKHVGSVMSLSAIPSDYVEETERRPSRSASVTSTTDWSPRFMGNRLAVIYLYSIVHSDWIWNFIFVITFRTWAGLIVKDPIVSGGGTRRKLPPKPK